MKTYNFSVEVEDAIINNNFIDNLLDEVADEKR